MRANLFLGCPGEVMNEFRIRCGFAGLALLSAVLSGCGGDMPRAAGNAAPEKAAKSTAPTAATPAAVVAATPIRTPAKAPPVTEAKSVRKVTLNPFQMPDIPEEFLAPKEEPKPAEYAAPVRPFERPKVRLLGFSDVDGFKALVELKGDVRAVEAGDVIEGVEVVSIEPPKVTFQFASSNWSTKLFDQPWSNQQTGIASSPGASRAFTNQSRSTPRTNAPAYATRAPLAAVIRGPSEPSMLDESTSEDTPEIGGNATPFIPGIPAIPGMPKGAGGVGIPGLGYLPGMPPPGAMPGMPGGPGATPGTPGGPGATPVGND